jgi:thioredoxin-like negative regulator of GroEL
MRYMNSLQTRVGKALLAAALVAAGLAVGGCGVQGKFTDLKTPEDFDREVVRAKKPVIVDFYKDNCPTCVVQEAETEKIIDDYRDQVVFVKFKIRDPAMGSASPEIMDRYKLFWVPTTSLFVNGQEVQRWELNHSEWEFREALNKILTPQAPGTTGQPGTPALPPAPPAPTPPGN